MLRDSSITCSLFECALTEHLHYHREAARSKANSAQSHLRWEKITCNVCWQCCAVGTMASTEYRLRCGPWEGSVPTKTLMSPASILSHHWSQCGTLGPIIVNRWHERLRSRPQYVGTSCIPFFLRGGQMETASVDNDQEWRQPSTCPVGSFLA